MTDRILNTLCTSLNELVCFLPSMTDQNRMYLICMVLLSMRNCVCTVRIQENNAIDRARTHMVHPLCVMAIYRAHACLITMLDSCLSACYLKKGVYLGNSFPDPFFHSREFGNVNIHSRDSQEWRLLQWWANPKSNPQPQILNLWTLNPKSKKANPKSQISKTQIKSNLQTLNHKSFPNLQKLTYYRRKLYERVCS